MIREYRLHQLTWKVSTFSVISQKLELISKLNLLYQIEESRLEELLALILTRLILISNFKIIAQRILNLFTGENMTRTQNRILRFHQSNS